MTGSSIRGEASSAGAAEVSQSCSGQLVPVGLEQGREAGSGSLMWKCQHFCVGGETAASLCFAFSVSTLLGKESGKPVEVLRGRKLQVAWSFVNAPFGVFGWTLPLGIQAGDEVKLTRSLEPCGAAGSTLPRLQRGAWFKISRKALSWMGHSEDRGVL